MPSHRRWVGGFCGPRRPRHCIGSMDFPMDHRGGNTMTHAPCMRPMPPRRHTACPRRNFNMPHCHRTPPSRAPCSSGSTSYEPFTNDGPCEDVTCPAADAMEEDFYHYRYVQEDDDQPCGVRYFLGKQESPCQTEPVEVVVREYHVRSQEGNHQNCGPSCPFHYPPPCHVPQPCPSAPPKIARIPCPNAPPPCPNALPPCPNALPPCPNALPPCPNVLPPCPNALPPCPNALPPCPNAPPPCPNYFQPCPNVPSPCLITPTPCPMSPPPCPNAPLPCPTNPPPCFYDPSCPNAAAPCPNPPPYDPYSQTPCPKGPPNCSNMPSPCPNGPPPCPNLPPPCPNAPSPCPNAPPTCAGPPCISNASKPCNQVSTSVECVPSNHSLGTMCSQRSVSFGCMLPLCPSDTYISRKSQAGSDDDSDHKKKKKKRKKHDNDHECRSSGCMLPFCPSDSSMKSNSSDEKHKKSWLKCKRKDEDKESTGSHSSRCMLPFCPETSSKDCMMPMCPSGHSMKERNGSNHSGHKQPSCCGEQLLLTMSTESLSRKNQADIKNKGKAADCKCDDKVASKDKKKAKKAKKKVIRRVMKNGVICECLTSDGETSSSESSVKKPKVSFIPCDCYDVKVSTSFLQKTEDIESNTSPLVKSMHKIKTIFERSSKERKLWKKESGNQREMVTESLLGNVEAELKTDNNIETGECFCRYPPAFKKLSCSAKESGNCSCKNIFTE